MRRALTVFAALTPVSAFAEGKMPQMDFSNPLTSSQVVWMVVILVALYLTLSRWGLPQVGAVLKNRSAVILADLNTAHAAKAAADAAVEALNATMARARQTAQAEVADMVAKAKARAAANAATLAARLDKNLAEAEARIDQARQAALAALKPVAEDATTAMLLKLTGTAPAPASVASHVNAALASAKAA